MKNDALSQISALTPILPKSQQKVAHYLINHWEKALYESSMTIAKKIDVGQSTVVRTVMSLGYSGFPEFQSMLRARLEDRFFTVVRIGHVSNLQKGHSLQKRIDQVFHQCHLNLDTAQKDLAPDQVAKAADLIWKGKRVFVLGLRTSGTLAHYFGLHLAMMRPNVTILSSDYMLLENISTLTPKDVIIAFSFQRYYRKTLDVITFIRNRGSCSIIGFTDDSNAPLSSMADIIFRVPVSSMYFGNSFVAACVVLDVLLSIIGGNNKRAVLKALHAMENGFSRLQMLFGKSDQNFDSNRLAGKPSGGADHLRARKKP